MIPIEFYNRLSSKIFTYFQNKVFFKIIFDFDSGLTIFKMGASLRLLFSTSDPVRICMLGLDCAGDNEMYILTCTLAHAFPYNVLGSRVPMFVKLQYIPEVENLFVIRGHVLNF